VKEVVVRLPGDLHNVEIQRHTEVVTDALEVLPFQRLVFEALADLVESVKEPAEPTIDLADTGELHLHAGRERNVESGRENCFPIDQLPSSTAEPVLPALDERGFDVDLGAHQMASLVPGRIPEYSGASLLTAPRRCRLRISRCK
jgi:hypothetical protein